MLRTSSLNIFIFPLNGLLMKSRILALPLAILAGASGLAACTSEDAMYEEAILGYMEGQYNGDPEAFLCSDTPRSTSVMDRVSTPVEDRPTFGMEVVSAEERETHTRVFFKMSASDDDETVTLGQLARLRPLGTTYCIESIDPAYIEGTDNYVPD